MSEPDAGSCPACKGLRERYYRIAIPHRTLEQYVQDVCDGRPDPPVIERRVCDECNGTGRK